MAITKRLSHKSKSSGTYKAHDARLSTVTMVEQTIKESDDPIGKTELWSRLSRKVQYPTFKDILDYLEASNKIIYDKNNKIVWIAADNPRLEEFFKKTVKLR